MTASEQFRDDFTRSLRLMRDAGMLPEPLSLYPSTQLAAYQPRERYEALVAVRTAAGNRFVFTCGCGHETAHEAKQCARSTVEESVRALAGPHTATAGADTPADERKGP